MLGVSRTTVGWTIASVLIALGCGGGDDNGGTTDPPTTGSLRVTVTAEGSARSGVNVSLFQGGGTTVTATQATGSDGRTTFGNVPAGTHDVEVDVPAGHSLDDGEEARKSVTVTAGSTANTSFALVDDNAENVVEITAVTPTFSDNDVTISVGTTVRWVNGDGVLHTVTPDGHDEWSNATIASSGDTFEHTFDTPGDFPYFCTPHQAQGMTGIIRVQ